MEQKKFEDYSDNELVEICRQGEMEAFQVLVNRYQAKVVGIAYGVSHNQEDANDIAQEVFVKIYRSLKKFRGDSKFYTWMYRITVNISIDYIRKKNRRRNITYLDEVKIEPDILMAGMKKSSPKEKLLLKEMYGKILDAIKTLSEDHRLTLVLREMNNLSYQDIAETMHCSVGTVMSRLFYARKKVREKLKPYLNDSQE
ncbi:sigma-70 family RNA polymerase sigma factor [bacterium]|nr:sigma-70 family RNA polymerase sigma factor [bacterium]